MNFMSNYQEQTYERDATVKAHLSRTSFSMQTDNIAQNLVLPVIEPQMSMLEIAITKLLALDPSLSLA